MQEWERGEKDWEESCLDCPGSHSLLRTTDKEVNSLPQGKQTAASNSDSWPASSLTFYFSTL